MISLSPRSGGGGRLVVSEPEVTRRLSALMRTELLIATDASGLKFSRMLAGRVIRFLIDGQHRRLLEFQFLVAVGGSDQHNALVGLDPALAR